MDGTYPSSPGELLAPLSPPSATTEPGGKVSERGLVDRSRKLSTRAIHAGEPRPGIGDAITMPLFQSSTYVLGNPEEFDDIRYIRLNNTPNQKAVEEKLAALEAVDAALVTPSGTSAIALAFGAFLRTGDHVVAPLQIYGGTRKILEALVSERGIRVSYLEQEDLEAWRAACTSDTRMLYTESITNPWIEVPPLLELAQLARERALISVIDNTIASPANFRPAELGYDLILHSASKYLNGHTDVVAGVLAGSAGHIKRLRKHANLMGICLDPNSCFLLQRGAKTMPLRVRAQNEGARKLAARLARHSAVRLVHHPSLGSSASRRRAERFFDGYGAMVSFVPYGDVELAERIIDRLELARVAPSLGGVETLICRPATTSHAGLPRELRLRMGVPDEMIRVSVGLEDPDDLIADFERALIEH